MPSFQDSAGRDWALDINVDSVDQVHRETNVSLYKLLDDQCQPLAELLDNPPVLAHVCYLLTDAQQRGVSQRDFAKAIKGDVFGSMCQAFLDELPTFFPDPRRRAAIVKLGQSWRSLEGKALARLSQELTKIDPDQVANDVLEKLMRTSETRSTSSPDSSALTPDA